MAFGETASLIAILKLNNQFSGPLAKASKDLSKFDTAVTQSGTRAFKAGQQIGLGIKNAAAFFVKSTAIVATGIGAVGVASLRAAGNFEAQLNTINTIARTNQSGIAAIGLAIRKVATDTGTSLDDLTTGYYDLLSAGIKTADAQNVLTNANKLAIGGLATTSQAVDLLTSAINTYGGDATKAAEYTDVFAKAVERGKVTAAGIAESFSIVGPLAQSAGISIQEIGAAFARLTSAGVPAAEAATQMRSALVALEKPTPALGALEDKLKKNYLAIAGKQGLVVALQQMATDAGKAGIPLIDLFGRIEAVNFTLATTGPNFAAYNADLAAMGKAAGTAAGQMAERQKGLNFQLARLKALAKDAGITIGSALLPKITPLIEKLNAFISGNQAGIAGFGDKLALLFSDANIKAGADALNGLFTTVQRLLPALQSGAEITGRVISTAVDAFKSLPPEIQALAVAGLAINKLTGGLVTNIAGGLISAVISSFKGFMNVNAAVVNVNGGVVNSAGDVVRTVEDTVVKGGIIGSIVKFLAGATLTGVATAAALVAVPAAIAAVGLAVTDPSNNARDRAKTAAARGGGRGTPIVDGKTIDDLTIATKKASSAEEQLGKSADDLAAVVLANTYATKEDTAAAKAFIAANHRAILMASAKARGIDWKPGDAPSTSLKSRFQFLAAGHSGKKDVAVGNALVEHFTNGSTNPLYTSDKNLVKSIKVLEKDQKQLLGRGDTKSAGKIAEAIRKMKEELKKRQDAAATKIKKAQADAATKIAAATNAQKMTVALTVDNRTIINGRLFEANLSRSTTTIGFGRYSGKSLPNTP